MKVKFLLVEEGHSVLIGEFRMNDSSKRRIAELRKRLSEHPALKCAKCGINIHETITGKYETAYGVLCKICFSKLLGEEIEKHPIRIAPLERASK